MTARTLTLVRDYVSETGFPPCQLTQAILTVLICDDALRRSGLRQILSGSPFAIAEAASIAESRRCQRLIAKAALVLIEASQNPGRVPEIVGQVREQAPEARIVVLAERYDLDLMRLGHAVGVNGFCSVASGPGVLIKSLELIMLGESVLPIEVLRSIMGRALQFPDWPFQDKTAGRRPSDLSNGRLSAKETQVLNYLRDGVPNKVIAHKLEITEATVKVHVKAIMRKIGVSNRTQAAMWASRCLPKTEASSLNV